MLVTASPNFGSYLFSQQLVRRKDVTKMEDSIHYENQEYEWTS